MKGIMPSASVPQIPSQRIERVHSDGLFVTSFEQRGVRELHITITAKPNEPLLLIMQRLRTAVKKHDATIVKQQVFGPTNLADEHARLAKLLFGPVTWPITWLEGAACNGAVISGIHVQAIAGAAVQTVTIDRHVFGCSYEDGFGRNLLLHITPHDTFCSEASQARQVYDELEAVLHDSGMRFGDVIRTWFFLDRILAWYGDFNKVRNFLYRKRKSPFLPASTGVGVRNHQASALALEAWAVERLDDNLKISELRSPLQCAAPKYGSGFSRAVEIQTPQSRRILVSGTASIDDAGRSIHDGNMRKQIEQTMEVVEAMLGSRNQTLADVSRATAYVKNIDDAPCFVNWCEERNLEMPVIITQADVCRDELLYEIELDTIQGRVG